MRLVSLRPWPNGPQLNLNPRITLIVGLLPFERVELVSTVHSIALGEIPVWEGSLELAGTEMNFIESAEVVGFRADNAPVITTDEIPMIVAESVADTDLLMSDPDGSVENALKKLAEIEDELSGAEVLRSELRGKVASASANFDESVFDELARVDGELKRAADSAERPDPWTGVADPTLRLQRVEELLSDVEARLTTVPAGDRAGLAHATARLRVALGEGDLPLPDAVRLSEQWQILEERRSDLSRRFRSLGFDHDGALARLEIGRAHV